MTTTRIHVYKKTRDGWRVVALPPGKDLAGTEWKKVAWSVPRPEGPKEPVAAELLLGKAAPPLAVDEWLNNGTVRSLADLRGKVVIVDFWATWCGPCIKEMPGLFALYAEKKALGLEVIGMTENRDSQTTAQVRKFVTEKAMPYPVAIAAGNDTSQAFGVGPIPHVFVLDRAGRVRFQAVGAGQGEKVRQIVEQLLAEK